MAKIKLSSKTVDLTCFDDEPKRKREITKILKLIDKYDTKEIKKVVQMGNKKQVLKDIVRFSYIICRLPL